MKISIKSRRLFNYGLIILGAYTALLIVNLPSFFYNWMQIPEPVNWWEQTIRLVWGMYVWVFFTPFILLVGYHFQIVRSRLWRNIPVHLIVGIVTGILRPITYSCGLWLIGVSNLEELFKPLTYIQGITGAIITYPSIIAIQHAYLYFRESQEREFRLQQAELQMLKMQLQPHFFFNTLNAISALIHTSPKEADQMIVRLGDIFRITLKKDRGQKVTLKEELDLLEAFLQIHRTLMGDRLQIEWQIDSATLSALVPNLILQPLVENSIQHGIAPRSSGGKLTIISQKSDGKLALQVCDDGAGFSLKTTNQNGNIGLSNTQSRLKNLYREAYNFSIEKPATGGTCVKIEIPYQAA